MVRATEEKEVMTMAPAGKGKKGGDSKDGKKGDYDSTG